MSKNQILEFVRLAVTVGVGLLGVLLGARLAQRRDRWNYRRELYAKLLMLLSEACLAASQLLWLEEDGDPASPRFQEWRTAASDRAASAMKRLRRISGIATAILGPHVDVVLDTLEAEWLRAGQEKTAHAGADRWSAAANRARDAIIAAARRDLKT
jgi:hypothetical protein